MCAPFRKEGCMKCINATKFHRKSGGAQWRDLLFLIRTIEFEWMHHPPLCHPDRSVAEWRDLRCAPRAFPNSGVKVQILR